MKQLGVFLFPPWMGCYSIRVHTTSSSWNFSNFPGVFKGINKKNPGPQLHVIFFRKSYLLSQSVRRGGFSKLSHLFFLYTLFITNQIQGVFQGWCLAKWLFKEFSRTPPGVVGLTPALNSTNTHLSTWVKRSNMRVKHLAQEHNAMLQPGCKPKPLLRAPAH